MARGRSSDAPQTLPRREGAFTLIARSVIFLHLEINNPRLSTISTLSTLQTVPRRGAYIPFSDTSRGSSHQVRLPPRGLPQLITIYITWTSFGTYSRFKPRHLALSFTSSLLPCPFFQTSSCLSPLGLSTTRLG